MRNLRTLKNCLKQIFMLLAEEGRDFSLHQISFDWVLGTKYYLEYSHHLWNGVIFYLCTSTEQATTQKSFAQNPHLCPESYLHVFTWETLVPFSGLGQETVRKDLSHWLHQVMHFPELQSWEDFQNPVANLQINPIYLTQKTCRSSCPTLSSLASVPGRRGLPCVLPVE